MVQRFPIPQSMWHLTWFAILFEGAGDLLNKKLIDFDIISILPIGHTWKKIEPLAEGARKQYNAPALWTEFEYLYNEIQKREQTLQTKQSWTIQ